MQHGIIVKDAILVSAVIGSEKWKLINWIDFVKATKESLANIDL